jgi:hypothetical protein
MQSLVYETPMETLYDTVARIGVAAGNIRQVPQIFQTVQNKIAKRCRTGYEFGGRHFEQLL